MDDDAVRPFDERLSGGKEKGIEMTVVAGGPGGGQSLGRRTVCASQPITIAVFVADSRRGLHQQMVQDRVVENHDGGLAPAEPVQNPMMVWIVPEVSENNVVSARRSVGRDRLNLPRPILGWRPSGGF